MTCQATHPNGTTCQLLNGHWPRAHQHQDGSTTWAWAGGDLRRPTRP